MPLIKRALPHPKESEGSNDMEIRDYFLINPAAGKKNRLEEMTRRIHQAAASLKREVEILATTCAGEATKLIERVVKTNPDQKLRFYICGGDGTFQEAVQGAVHQPLVAVAPVPIGSGNDWIRSWEGYTKEDFLNLEALMEGEICPIDALDVNGKICANVASVGLDAKTARMMPALRRVPFMGGKLSYIISLGVAFFTATKNRIAFEIDGVPLDYGKKDCIIASFANGRYYGGGFQTAPRAYMDDGEMEFLCVPSISRLKFLRCVGIYKKGEHLEKLPFVHYCRCKNIRLLSEKTIWVNVDGEVFPMENPVVQILEKAVNIILPRKEGLAQG